MLKAWYNSSMEFTPAITASVKFDFPDAIVIEQSYYDEDGIPGLQVIPRDAGNAFDVLDEDDYRKECEKRGVLPSPWDNA